jgi:integrase
MSSSRVNLTVARLDSFSCTEGKSQEFLWDTQSPGLGVRVTKNDSKAFVFQSRIADGSSPRITIGSTATWKLGEARERARELKLLTDRGLNPRDVIKEEAAQAVAAKALSNSQEARNKLTARDAWDTYLRATHNWSDRHRKDLVNAAAIGGTDCKIGKRKAVQGPLAPLLALPLTQITPEVVSNWLTTQGKKRATVTANAFRKFRAFINWCLDHPSYSSVVVNNCCTHRTVKAALPKTKASKDDSLLREQLAKWFEAVQGIRNPAISTYLQALLLTGARRTELIALERKNINRARNSFTIRDKNDGVREVPLTPYVKHLLDRLPEASDWAFPSKESKSGHIVSPSKAYAQALVKAGLPHVSLHGLRRSFITLADWQGDIPAGAVAQIVGHKPSALAEKHYKKRPIDMLLQWHAKLEGWILEEAKIKWNASNS